MTTVSTDFTPSLILTTLQVIVLSRWAQFVVMLKQFLGLKEGSKKRMTLAI
jgi:hypothetical protein